MCPLPLQRQLIMNREMSSSIDFGRLPDFVHIEYHNQSQNPKILVVVASKNVSEQLHESEKDTLVAWKVLATQTKIIFRYPQATEVGATYKFAHAHEIVMSGPFKADPGSHWRITQESMHEAPLLLEGELVSDALHKDSMQPILSGLVKNPHFSVQKWR